LTRVCEIGEGIEKRMAIVTSFQPIIDSNTRVLILGSMPGVQSLKEQRYYANNRNQFWRIIYSIFETSVELDYDKRILFIKKKGIGLWDVLYSCSRPGSLDSNIKNEKVNDFENLFRTYPNIKVVLFNGSKAFEVFRKNIGFERFRLITFLKLPSTSPAHTKLFDQKLKEWTIISNFLV
jgi:hypoxanthine-DNA glycosylase